MDFGFTTSTLKEHIAKDLKIDVAFPFFSSGKNKGTAACCVVSQLQSLLYSAFFLKFIYYFIFAYITLNTIQVDTEWIDTLCNASINTTSLNNGDNNNATGTSKGAFINVKTPSYVRHIPTDPSQQKQAPTNNIYVNMLPKMALSSSKR